MEEVPELDLRAKSNALGPRVQVEGETDLDSVWGMGKERGQRCCPQGCTGKWWLGGLPMMMMGSQRRAGEGAGFRGAMSNLRARRRLGWRHHQRHKRAGATGVSERTGEGLKQAGLRGKGPREQAERKGWEMREKAQNRAQPGGLDDGRQAGELGWGQGEWKLLE